jgi:hypothetical protein
MPYQQEAPHPLLPQDAALPPVRFSGPGPEKAGAPSPPPPRRGVLFFARSGFCRYGRAGLSARTRRGLMPAALGSGSSPERRGGLRLQSPAIEFRRPQPPPIRHPGLDPGSRAARADGARRPGFRIKSGTTTEGGLRLQSPAIEFRRPHPPPIRHPGLDPLSRAARADGARRPRFRIKSGTTTEGGLHMQSPAIEFRRPQPPPIRHPGLDPGSRAARADGARRPRFRINLGATGRRRAAPAFAGACRGCGRPNSRRRG